MEKSVNKARQSFDFLLFPHAHCSKLSSTVLEIKFFQWMLMTKRSDQLIDWLADWLLYLVLLYPLPSQFCLVLLTPILRWIWPLIIIMLPEYYYYYFFFDIVISSRKKKKNHISTLIEFVGNLVLIKNANGRCSLFFFFFLWTGLFKKTEEKWLTSIYFSSANFHRHFISNRFRFLAVLVGHEKMLLSFCFSPSPLFLPFISVVFLSYYLPVEKFKVVFTSFVGKLTDCF